jgi:hypothetical protein
MCSSLQARASLSVPAANRGSGQLHVENLIFMVLHLMLPLANKILVVLNELLTLEELGSLPRVGQAFVKHGTLVL